MKTFMYLFVSRQSFDRGRVGVTAAVGPSAREATDREVVEVVLLLEAGQELPFLPSMKTLLP